MLIAYFSLSAVLIAINLLSRRRNFTRLLTGLFILIQVLITVWMCYNPNKNVLGLFLIDDAAILFSVIMSFLCMATWYYSKQIIDAEKHRSLKSFGAGFIGLAASITGVYCASNLTVSWIFLEATTLCVAILIYHNRTVRALEASWKYIFVTSVGIALAYIGILFISLTIKHTSSPDLSYANLAQVLPMANPLYLKLAFLFVLIGYSAKMEIFPLYTIGIDANYVAPSPVSAFISTAMVNAGFVAIYRLYKALAFTIVKDWAGHILILTGIISLLIAAIYLLRVKNYKRMFAYSTLEHMGMVVIGMGIGGKAMIAAIFLIVLHSFVKSGMFFQLGLAHKILKTYSIGKTGDYFRINPAGAMVILAGTIVLSAIPPSGFFIPEWMIFTSLAMSGNWILFIVIAILLCFALYGIFSKILPFLFIQTGTPYSESSHILRRETIIQFLFIFICLEFCFYRPSFFIEMAGRIADMSINIVR